MNLIKSHKIVTATILVGIIGSAAGIAVINQPVDNQVRHVSEMAVEPKERVEDTPPVTTPEPVLEAPAPEVVDVPVVEAVEEPVEPATVSDEDIFNVVWTTLANAGYTRIGGITNVGIVNAIHHHTLESTTRYTEQEIKSMTLKCIGYVRDNIDSYRKEYGTMADGTLKLDMLNTPCWLL